MLIVLPLVGLDSCSIGFGMHCDGSCGCCGCGCNNAARGSSLCGTGCQTSFAALCSLHHIYVNVVVRQNRGHLCVLTRQKH